MIIVRACVVALLLFGTTGTKAAIWTDMWWNPAESGWGVNVVQQHNVMFLTFFVYTPSGTAKWYSGTVRPGAILPSGYARWDGDLLESSGPYFGGPFNSNGVSSRRVGAVSFLPSAVGRASLAYSVDGATVNKAIERTTFNHIPLGGTYAGGYSVKRSTCSWVPVGTLGSIDLVISATVNPGAPTGNILTSVSFDLDTPCVLAGTYRQYGSVYSVANVAACPASIGLISYNDLHSSDDSIDGNMAINVSGCTVGIAFGAARR